MENSQWSEDWYRRKWEPSKAVENLPLCHHVPEGGRLLFGILITLGGAVGASQTRLCFFFFTVE